MMTVVVLACTALACADDRDDATSETSTTANASETSAGTGDGDGEPSTGDGDGEPGTGDGDGEASTGDGDGEASTGDGDGEPGTGDGDGEPGTGDGDGEPSTGDGDGDSQCANEGQSCAMGEACCNGLMCCGGVPIPPGEEFCGSPCPMSDRNLKHEFATVDTQWVLDQLVELPLSTWRYKKGGARHIGPMAQDFYASFEVGDTDKLIFQIDADGVSFAAIQALDAKLDVLEAENQDLRERLESLEARLDALEQPR